MPKKDQPAPATLEEVAKETVRPIETVTVQETLRVDLTDEEYKNVAILMGHANAEISAAEDQLAAVKSQFKSRIDAAVAKRNEYAGIINAGCEYKPVDCWLTKDWGAGSITVTRQDTGEVIRTRPMSPEEKQRGLQFQEDHGPGQEAAPDPGEEEGADPGSDF